jgi:hypothetical protein
MIILLKKLYNFIIYPILDTVTILNWKQKLKHTLFFYVFSLILSVFFVLLIKFFFNLNNVGISQIKEEWSLLKLLFIGSLILPILEEIVFRLPLKFKPINISISFFFLIYAFISKVFFNVGYLTINFNVIIIMFFSLFFGFLIYFFMLKNFDYFNTFWNKNFRWIYYFSVFSFGLLHIGNFQIDKLSFIILPLLVLPQLTSGFIAGYLRIKYGFIYCCFFHIVNNFISLMI